MQFQYDAQVDAMSAQLTPGGKGIITKEVAPGIYLDFDKKGRLVAIEVLNASKHVPREILEQHPYTVEYMTLAEAGKESGLSPDTLRRQINNGRIEAIKRGRDWLIDELSLVNYLESRSPAGRPSVKGRKQKSRNSGKGSGRKIAA